MIFDSYASYSSQIEYAVRTINLLIMNRYAQRTLHGLIIVG